MHLLDFHEAPQTLQLSKGMACCLQIPEEWELPKDEGLEKLWMIDSKQLQVALDESGQPVLLGKGAYGAVSPSACPLVVALRCFFRWPRCSCFFFCFCLKSVSVCRLKIRCREDGSRGLLACSMISCASRLRTPIFLA